MAISPHNMNKKYFAIGFLVAGFLLYFGGVISAETQAIITADPNAAPRVTLTDLNITKNEDGKIEGSFFLENMEDNFIADFQYEIKLFKGSDFRKLEFIDMYLSSEVFALPPHQKLRKNFIYSYPQNINDGNYTIIAQIITGRGMELNWQSQIIQLEGNNKFLEILSETSRVISGSKTGLPFEGINVNSTDDVFSSFEVKNLGEETTVVPHLKIYQRQYNMPLVKEYDDQPITFKSNETKQVKLLLPKFEKPESYLAEIIIYRDNAPASGINYARWVVKGLSGKILYVKFDKDYFVAGENLELSVQTVGPADNSIANSGKLEVIVTNNDGEELGATSKDISLDELLTTKMVIPIKDDVIRPVVKVKLLKDQTVLDERIIGIPLFSEEGKQLEKQIESKKANKILEEYKSRTKLTFLLIVVGAILLAVILVIIGFFILKNVKKI